MCGLAGYLTRGADPSDPRASSIGRVGIQL